MKPKRKVKGRPSVKAKGRAAGSPGRAKRATQPTAAAEAIPSKWSWHHRTLVALRDQLVSDSELKRRAAAEPIEGHSMHPADSGTDEFEHDVAIAMLGREENALREINDAITRIREGRYGVCEATGAAIDPRRLRAVPWCRFSRVAEERLERGDAHLRVAVPPLVSVRGPKGGLPGTGTITRADSEGPLEEPKERAAALTEDSPASLAEATEARAGTAPGAAAGAAASG